MLSGAIRKAGFPNIRGLLTGTATLSRETMVDVLSNRRRRYILHILKHHNGQPVPIRELAEQIASWEQDKPVEQLTYQERNNIQTALRQFHLPKMMEAGLVEYDKRSGWIRLTDTATNQEFYVDMLSEGGIPWGLYHLVAAIIALICLSGIWFDIYPFTLLPSLVWFLGVTTMFLMSSIGHFYDNYFRMRLGAREKPVEAE